MKKAINPLLFAELCRTLSSADLETLAAWLRNVREENKEKPNRPLDWALRQLAATYYQKTRERLNFSATGRFVVYRLDCPVPVFVCETELKLSDYAKKLEESPDNFIAFDQSVGRRKSLSNYFDPF